MIVRIYPIIIQLIDTQDHHLLNEQDAAKSHLQFAIADQK